MSLGCAWLKTGIKLGGSLKFLFCLLFFTLPLQCFGQVEMYGSIIRRKLDRGTKLGDGAVEISGIQQPSS